MTDIQIEEGGTMKAPTRYEVKREDGMCVGHISFNINKNGWRFFPHFQAKPSRKFWPTPEATIKRFKSFSIIPRPGEEGEEK